MPTAELKKLSPRHKEIARRCLVGETPKEISEDLGMHQGTIVQLMNQVLFKQEMGKLEYETEQRLTNAKERLSVLEIFGDTEAKAAQLCADVVNDEVTPNATKPGAVPMATELRLKSAWDILDRQGYKAVEKRMTVSLSDLIIAAREKAKAATIKKGKEPIDVTSGRE